MNGEVLTYNVPRGNRGILRTVRMMRRIVHASMSEPLTVESAALISSPYCCGAERAQAIREFLRERVVFCPDPVGNELLRTPEFQLRTIREMGHASGDCDDVAILGAALGMAVGLPARFVLLSFQPDGSFSHIFTELSTPEGWVELDTTAPAQFPDGLQIYDTKTVGV